MTAQHEQEPVEPVGDPPAGSTGHPRRQQDRPQDRQHDRPHDRPHGRQQERHETVGRSGQGRHGGEASVEPGGDDEYDVVVPDTPESLVDDHTATEVVDGDVVDGGETETVDEGAAVPGGAPVDDVHPDTRKAREHLEDLRRLQAEYVNYKKRVDRDRDLARERGVSQVIEALLPVLDDIHAAREHGDLEGGPFAAIADKLEGILGRFGVVTLGAKGEEFDPTIHEALMHVQTELPEDARTTTVVQVIQPGFKMGERVVRPARVSVADPT